MNCPKCKSENVQTLQMVHNQGTSISSSESKTHAGGFLDIIPSVKAKTKTSGVSYSKLALKAQAPEKKKIIVSGGIVILAALLFPLQFESFSIISLLIHVGIIGICGKITYDRLKFNKEEWPALMNEWENSWMCHKCGSIFQPE